MLEDVATDIKQRTQASNDKNLIIGISGVDGSGKSTFATQLTQALASENVVATQIDLDDFLQPKEIRHCREDQVTGYFEDNFDYSSLVNRVLLPAREETSFKATLPTLELETDQVLERDFKFIGPGVLIIEGVFLFRKELREHFDLKIWLDISFEDAMNRVLQRQRDQRYGDINAIRARYEERFFPTQRFHIKRDDPASTADLIISVP